MYNNGFSEFKPGYLYKWACYYCQVVSENCNLTSDLATIMAIYRRLAKFGDKKGSKHKFAKEWEEGLAPVFLLITCYLHDKAVKGKRDKNQQ